MDQSEIDEYAKRLAPSLSAEAYALLAVASLIGMKKMKDGLIDNVDDALVGGILVIHGNSLVAAHYREISDKSFGRDTYFLFPVLKSQLHDTIRKLSGVKNKTHFPEYRKGVLNACIFYGSGQSIVELKEDKSPEGMSKTATLIGEKLAGLQDGPELMRMFSEMFGGAKA